MNEKKYVVPARMLEAALQASGMPSTGHYEEMVRLVLEAALRWLSDNPPEISRLWVNEARKYSDGHPFPEYRYMFKTAFLAPEIPEAIKDLVEGMSWNSSTPEAIIEAYRRGKEN